MQVFNNGKGVKVTDRIASVILIDLKRYLFASRAEDDGG